MRPLASGSAYGLSGFAAGFVFGTLREIVLIPAFGESAGRWIEFIPLVCTIAFLGLWIARRFMISGTTEALACGLAGIAVLLVLESGFALIVLGMPLETYMAGFNILQGALFPYGLIIMALAPLVAVRLRNTA